MKLKRILFFELLFTVGLINAQTDFRAGYIVKENNDTLIGEIDYRGDLKMGETCKFRVNDKGKEIKYSPNDIVEYRFNESKYFVSKELNGKKTFLEFLIKGQINIYYLRNDSGDHYFLEKDGANIIEIPYEEGIRYKDDIPYFYKTTKHIGILNYYMQDAPGFQSRIAKIGKPEHESLIKLAEDYHRKVCKNGACIIYEKKLPLLKFNIEIGGGIVNYQNADDINDKKKYFQVGLLSHFWMPRVSEKMYFRTGVLYSKIDANNVKKSIYKIPIQIEYIYPKGIIRPIMAFGINMYSPTYQSVALMGGLNIKLNKSIYFGVYYDIDFYPNEKFAILPKNILAQSILAGFIVKL